MYAGGVAVKQGYKDVLYLNPETKMIDEFSSANFFGIKGNTYVTPSAKKTILPSITNKSLEQVAKDLGMETERRDIPVDELSTFEEIGQCGTAVVITPVKLIDDKEALAADSVTKSYSYPDECGPKSRKLYETLTGIQYGEIEDKHNWCTFVEE
jgi:branched-chain amino acid aminotransferase